MTYWRRPLLCQALSDSNLSSTSPFCFRQNSIPVRRRLRNNQEMNLITRVIPHLVRCARRDPHPLPRSEHRQLAIHLHDGLTRKHVEELLRVMMKVPNLGRARRHALLNYAQLRILYQMPAITMAAPDVMLGGRFAQRSEFLTIHRSANCEIANDEQRTSNDKRLTTSD